MKHKKLLSIFLLFFSMSLINSANAVNPTKNFLTLNKVVKDNYKPAPDVTPSGHSSLNKGEWFYASKYQKWAWCGTSCWVIVNPIDKEVMVLDGYISKGTVGNVEKFNYATSRSLDRIVRLANFLRNLNENGYTIVGLITLHHHGDHTGDIGTLQWALRNPKGKQVDDKDAGNDISTVRLKYKPLTEEEANQIPIIGDADSVVSPWHARGYPVKRHMTHFINFIDNGVDDNFIEFFSTTVKFASKANLFRTVNGVIQGNAIVCNTNTTCKGGGSFKLGHFEVQPYIWDHLGIISSAYRTLALRIWHDSADDARRVFITGSRGTNVNHVPNGINIMTDHLIYAWGASSENAATIAKNHIRFYDRNSTSSVLANHHDPNDCDAAFPFNNSCKMRNYRVDNMIRDMRDVGAIIKGQKCDQWHTSTNQCIRVVKFGNRIGFDNTDWSKYLTNELGCSTYCKNNSDCNVCVAGSNCGTNQSQLELFNKADGDSYTACHKITNKEVCDSYCDPLKPSGQCDGCVKDNCGAGQTNIRSFGGYFGTPYTACNNLTNKQLCTNYCEGDDQCDACSLGNRCDEGQGFIQTFSRGTQSNYTACSRPDYGLSVKHYVNGQPGDTFAKRVLFEDLEIDVKFRVKNTGKNPLYQVRTYQRQAQPVQGHWEKLCTMGQLESGDILKPGEVRYCKGTISFNFSGLFLGVRKVIGIAQGLKSPPNYSPSMPFSKEDAVRATNPSYFQFKAVPFGGDQ